MPAKKINNAPTLKGSKSTLILLWTLQGPKKDLNNLQKILQRHSLGLLGFEKRTKTLFGFHSIWRHHHPFLIFKTIKAQKEIDTFKLSYKQKQKIKVLALNQSLKNYYFNP